MSFFFFSPRRGPVEDRVLLGNIKKCLTSIEKEKVLLKNLKTEQRNLSRHLTRMDMELTQSQVNQVEQWWKQMEDSLERKQIQVTAEAGEFKLFIDKAQDLQYLLQQQHHLQARQGSPPGADEVHPALMAAELGSLKHDVSLLKRDAEMRMKRIWADPEKTALESMIGELQNQIEELEQLTPKEDVQKYGNDLQVSEIMKKIEEALLWVKVSMLHLDEKAALFPDELMLQIKSYQAMLSIAKEKESTFQGLVDGAQCFASRLPSNEAAVLHLPGQELQSCYQHLILRLVQKTQHLEPQLEKRHTLFVEMGKIEKKLQKMETLSSLETGECSPKSELKHWQTILENVPDEIQEVEGFVDAANKDSPRGINVFEQMFLNDCLRSLKSQAKRAHRLIQMKGHAIQNKIQICEKFTKKTTSLQQDLSRFQCCELGIDPMKQTLPDQEVKGKLIVMREKVAALHSGLSHLEKYKEIWEWLGLKWDASQLDELQSQFVRIKNQLEEQVSCFDKLSTEGDSYQTALSAAEAVVSDLQKDCRSLQDSLDSTYETDLMSEKILNRRAQNAWHLTQEALRLLGKSETLDASLRETKIQEVKSLEAKIDGLTQMIQAKILAVEKWRYKQSFQGKLDHHLRVLKQIQSELQQPLLFDLETEMIFSEKMYCQVLGDALETEYLVAEDLINKKRGAQNVKPSSPDILRTKLEELQNLKKQMKVDLATRVVSLDVFPT